MLSKFIKYLSCIIAMAVASTPMLSFAEIEEVVVTANKREESIQDVSVSVTALDDVAIERAGIVDIRGLETVVPGLRIGSSGGEVRPAMRGARTNDVGVAGPGIAEQVIGIFQDGIYSPTTTAGLGAYVDIERIEVLRGPQGTLYGRNTFAGSINIISKTPDFDAVGGSGKVLHGDYNRKSYEGVLNLPFSSDFATRFVVSSDAHDGIIENLHLDGNAADLRDRDRFYLRSTSQWSPADELSATLRIDYSKKDQAADAIWGYQQIAGYSLTRADGYTPTNRVYLPNATVTRGHIYQGNTGLSNNQVGRRNARSAEIQLGPDEMAGTPDDVSKTDADAMALQQLPDSALTNDDRGPYEVFRNGPSWDRQETFSTTFAVDWSGLDFADTKFTINHSELKGSQYYDSDYSDNGNDLNGFGRYDDQEAISLELQLTSTHEGPWSWVGGLYYFDQTTDWYWLFDALDDETRLVIGACCGTFSVNDPHTAESKAIYGQATYDVTERFRVIGGLRFNDDEKEFTGNVSDWDDTAVLWKAAAEWDVLDDSLAYASIATGIRTGGANDSRVVARGAPATYDNEDVISYEIGLKSTLFNNTMTLNLSAFANTYEDVKAQLFAVACNDSDVTSLAACTGTFVLRGANTDRALQTWEYSENGGDVDSHGLELEALFAPTDELLLNFNVTYLDSEFDNDYRVGNCRMRPLLGLGNLGNRQRINYRCPADTVNDAGAEFSFGGWAPALSPEWTIGWGGAYDIRTDGVIGRGVLTPSAQFRWVDDYYGFDVNIPEVLQESHVIGDARLTWVLEDANIQLDAFVMNMFDEEVLIRATVHSQLVNGDPINSVQANYNNPRTWGLSIKYFF